MKTHPDFIEPHNIIFLKGDINYSEIYLNTGHKIVSCKTLLRHQEVFPNFLRIHRSYLVNPQYITKVEGIAGEQEVVISNGNRIKVARRRQIKNNFL